MASVATPLIASLDAFYAVWKCTRELESASLVLGAGEEVVPPYLTHNGQFEASLAPEGAALSR